MKCISCGVKSLPGTTTDVTELNGCLIIVKNVPCHKCPECNEIMYTADVVKHLQTIVKAAEKVLSEITVVDYKSMAA